MSKLKLVSLISIFCIITACISTPLPNPVNIKEIGDADLSCDYLQAEYKGNTEAAARKISKNNSGDAKDFALGLLIWPGLADFNNAPGHEGNALLDRNAWLMSLAEIEDKNCDTSDWPEQPKRY